MVVHAGCTCNGNTLPNLGLKRCCGAALLATAAFAKCGQFKLHRQEVALLHATICNWVQNGVLYAEVNCEVVFPSLSVSDLQPLQSKVIVGCVCTLVFAAFVPALDTCSMCNFELDLDLDYLFEERKPQVVVEQKKADAPGKVCTPLVPEQMPGAWKYPSVHDGENKSRPLTSTAMSSSKSALAERGVKRPAPTKQDKVASVAVAAAQAAASAARAATNAIKHLEALPATNKKMKQSAVSSSSSSSSLGKAMAEVHSTVHDSSPEREQEEDVIDCSDGDGSSPGTVQEAEDKCENLDGESDAFKAIVADQQEKNHADHTDSLDDKEGAHGRQCQGLRCKNQTENKSNDQKQMASTRQRSGDKKKRAPRGTALTFAGRRPPKNEARFAEFMQLRNDYFKQLQESKALAVESATSAGVRAKKRVPSASQQEYWAFMKKTMKEQSGSSRERFRAASTAWRERSKAE